VSRLTVALIVVVVLASGLALVWAVQRRLMYFPMGNVPTPAVLGLTNVQPVEFTAADGIVLHGWFFRSSSPATATVLVFNGNAGNLAYRAGLATGLRASGVNVLLFDYRGYGDSTGTPTEEGLATDGRAARAWLQQQPETRHTPLVYFGESLGAAVAVELAAAAPPAGLVLRSPFTSMIDMGRLHYPLLPVRLLLRDRFPSIDRIAGIRVPLLVIAGDRDQIIPIENTRRLYDAAGSTKKELVVVAGADHNDVELAEGPAILVPTVQFVRGLGSR
jgi:fermentation-respiration switch protein FrsA (DUF1100 family)